MSNPPNPSEVLGEFVLPERLARYRKVASLRTDSLTLVLDKVHHAHNISAVIRSADAFGLRGIHLVGEEFSLSRGITIGSEERLEIKKHASSNEAISFLKNAGYQLVITEPLRSQAQQHDTLAFPVHALPFNKRLALVFGNEVSGANDEFRQAADITTYIPMFGFVESLNVSVAAAICLFCSTITGDNNNRLVPPLNSAEQERLVENWLKNDVRGAETILEAAKTDIHTK